MSDPHMPAHIANRGEERKTRLHTGLQGLLIYVVGKGSNAFVGNGGQREEVLCVGAETFHHVGRRRPERFGDLTGTRRKT